MTDIVFKPEGAPRVKGCGLYRAIMNKKPLDLHFRAHTAQEADRMLQYLFEVQTKGKTISFSVDEFIKTDGKNATEGTSEQKG